MIGMSCVACRHYLLRAIDTGFDRHNRLERACDTTAGLPTLVRHSERIFQPVERVRQRFVIGNDRIFINNGNASRSAAAAVDTRDHHIYRLDLGAQGAGGAASVSLL